MKLSSLNTTAGTGFTMADRKPVTITEDTISATIENWDLQAVGQRIFGAVLTHDRTTGGIFIPESAQESQGDAVVISAGPLAYINDRQATGDEEERRRNMSPDEMDCASRRFLKPGDRFTIISWNKTTVSRKGSVKKGLDTLMVINADDVIGVPR